MPLALMVAPQRNTLYGNLARALALPEILASPVGDHLREWERRHFAGQDWVVLDLDDQPSALDFDILDRLGTVGGAFDFYDTLGGVDGPLLRPIESAWTPFVPREIVETRRYRGKTNELFTTVLLNLALFASDWRDRISERLRILDPLAGGGTTLFTALTRGYDAVGIEREKGDIDTTDAYVRQFLRGLGIPFKQVEERVRGVGRRSLFAIGRDADTRTLGLVLGDTFDAPDLLAGIPGGARFHAIVADLPYGIQHQGPVRRFLEDGLPRWAQVLLPGGATALGWDAGGLRRAEAMAIVETLPGLRVLDDPPYDALEHPVDRQIKRRDVLIIRKD